MYFHNIVTGIGIEEIVIFAKLSGYFSPLYYHLSPDARSLRNSEYEADRIAVENYS
jgi:hypothetical protein